MGEFVPDIRGPTEVKITATFTYCKRLQEYDLRYTDPIRINLLGFWCIFKHGGFYAVRQTPLLSCFAFLPRVNVIFLPRRSGSNVTWRQEGATAVNGLTPPTCGTFQLTIHIISPMSRMRRIQTHSPRELVKHFTDDYSCTIITLIRRHEFTSTWTQGCAAQLGLARMSL